MSVTSPAAGAAFSVGETVTVSWSGADTDGGALSYTPMLSTDDGVTWAPLACDTAETTCEFVPTRSQVTESAKVKVLVTDSVNSGEDVTGAFAIRPVVPTSAGGGGVPTWGPVIGFPKPASMTDPKYIDPVTWTLGAHGDTVYASWLDQSDLYDTKDHLRVMKSTDRGTSWGPAFDMSGPMDLDGGAEDPDGMQVFTFVGDVVYTLSFERIDADNRKLVVRKSRDGGASVETSSVVTTSKRSPAYPNVQRPKMVVDGANVYVLTDVVASASSMQVWLFKSTDGGATFGGPTVVTQGPWNGVGSIGNAQFCVEGDSVYVTFSYGNTNLYGPPDAAMAVSHDGGATFSPPETRLTNVYLPSVAAEEGRVYVAAYAWPVADGVKLTASDDYGAAFGAARDSQRGLDGRLRGVAAEDPHARRPCHRHLAGPRRRFVDPLADVLGGQRRRGCDLRAHL